jgi:hypothetical protein
MRPAAFCERAPAVTRACYERLFTLRTVILSGRKPCVTIVIVLATCKGKAYEYLFRTLKHSLAGVGGLDYAAHEARFEAKTSERNRTGGRTRRRIFVAGGRRIGSTRADH